MFGWELKSENVEGNVLRIRSYSYYLGSRKHGEVRRPTKYMDG